VLLGGSGAVALQAHHVQNDRMMYDAVERGHRGHRVFENLVPLAKDEVRGDDNRSTFVSLSTSLLIMRPFLAISANWA
jgi:hypothetical protein